MLHQICLNLLIRHRLELQQHASGTDRVEKALLVCREQQNDRILRRLLDRLQDRVLRLHRQLLRLRDDVNLIFSIIGTNLYIAYELLPDVLHADAVRLLVCEMNDVRMIAARRLLTGMTAAA